MTRRVQEDSVGRTGLLLVFGCTNIDYCRLGGIKVVNDYIEVHLLRPVLSGPLRRGVTSHPMKGDAPAVASTNRSPVSGYVNLPIQHRAVEPR